MRFISTLLFVLLSVSSLHAQNAADLNEWLTDDFSGGTLGDSWHQAAGTWSIDGESLKATGGEGAFALFNETYFLKTRGFVYEATLESAGTGILFNGESYGRLANCQAVKFLDGFVSMGYYNFLGEYMETRVVTAVIDWPAHVTVYTNPEKKNYSVIVGKKNIALEELRFNSGYAGLIAVSSGARFGNVKILGKGSLYKPSFFMKSNKPQIDDLSYMTSARGGLYIVNSTVGIVQRLTSVGTYVSEVQVDVENARLRGLCVDEEKWMYVVDAGNKSVRVYNALNELERVITGDLEDPQDVAVDGSTIYVLDKKGIVLFTKAGEQKGRKAAGLFKFPRNIYLHGSHLYVSDCGNKQVQILDKSTFSVERVIQEELVAPWGMAVDTADGSLYVADPGAAAVFHYTAEGGFIERIDPLTIRGFISPRAVLVLNRMIYVADFDRILGFKEGVLTIRPTLRLD